MWVTYVCSCWRRSVSGVGEENLIGSVAEQVAGMAALRIGAVGLSRGHAHPVTWSAAEHGQAGEVVCGGEEVEVGVDLGRAAHPGSSSAVAASHQVAELAFDLGAGGPVVGDPVRVLLAGAGVGQALLVAADA